MEQAKLQSVNPDPEKSGCYICVYTGEQSGKTYTTVQDWYAAGLIPMQANFKQSDSD